ncbi:MAG: hypothetical protein AB1847_11450 [bacterium]
MQKRLETAGEVHDVSGIIKRKDLIAIILFLILLQGNPIRAGALGGRRRSQAGGRLFSGQNIGSKRESAPGSPLESLGGNKAKQTGGGDDWISRAVRFENYLSGMEEGETGRTLLVKRGPRMKRTAVQKAEKAPDHSPAMTADDKGNIYLVWEHGNELFWAVNKGGAWTGSGKMPGAGGSRPVIVYIPHFFAHDLSMDQNGPKDMNTHPSADQDQSANPGTNADQDAIAGAADQGAEVCAELFCAFESLTAPKRIMGSAGTLTDSGITWSEPLALTSDRNEDSGIALIADTSGHPLMLWLQRASYEDDSDLYYQVIASTDLSATANQIVAASGSAMQATNSGGQAASGGQTPNGSPAAGSASGTGTDDGRAAPAPSAGGDPVPPSNWVGQAPAPIDIAGPFSPYVTSNCVSILLTKATINLPSQIPMLGETAELEITNFTCANSGVSTVSSSGVLTPVAIDELTAQLTLGPHLTLGFNLFSLGQAAIAAGTTPAGGGCCPAVQETIWSHGGSTAFLYLSEPFLLHACGQSLGISRLGVVGGVGASFSYIRFPENPEVPNQFVTQLAVAMGPQEVFSSLGSKLQGFITLAGGYSLSWSASARSRPSFIGTPFIALSGAVRYGGVWAGVLRRFARAYTPETGGGSGYRRGWCWAGSANGGGRPFRDPNVSYSSSDTASYQRVRPWSYTSINRGGGSLCDPNAAFYQRVWPWISPYVSEEKAMSQNSVYSLQGVTESGDNLSPLDEGDLPYTQKPLTVQSEKGKLTETMSSIIEEGKALMDEMLETVKEPLIGTGNVYEGKPVLSDISGDIYNDGVAAAAKNGSGEIVIVWAKAFAAQTLGTKICTAAYTPAGGWSSPVEVTPKIDFHDDPAIVFDSGDIPMAVWPSASNEGLDYEQSSVMEIIAAFEKKDLMYSRRIGGKWSDPKLLAKLPGMDEQVRLAAGPNDEITAVWINQSAKGSCLYGSLWNGSRWTEPKAISNAALAESPQVVYTDKTPSVVWAQDTDGQINTSEDWKLYFSRWDGTSWRSQPLLFSEDTPGEKAINRRRLPGRLNVRTPVRKRGGGRRATTVFKEGATDYANKT